MDQFFTSLNKRQTMMLLTAITFGGQEGVAALEHLPEEEAELLQHRAQEILQIPREKRIPLLVQEIKRLVKDRRGQLWSAEPERLAGLLKRERAALVEVVMRALPGPLADAVRSHLPSAGKVKLTREVRPQVLDIVRWKLEERLSRESSPHVPFKFTDVLLLQTRELLTVCDRLGARVLGPALAGVPDADREPAFTGLPPHLRQLATRSVTANAPRKLAEEDARAQLAQYGGLENLAAAIRGAGVHRLARASVAQSAEFAARLLEKHRGDFGQILTKWVREERSRPTTRGDGGRTDIVTDLERLAARGLIDRPVRLTPPRPPALGPPPASGGKGVVAPVASRAPVVSREGRAGASSEGSVRRSVSTQSQSLSGVRRDPIAEREARRAGASSNYAGRGQEAPPEASPSRVSRVGTNLSSAGRGQEVPPEASPSRVSRVGTNLSSAGRGQEVPPEASPSRVSRVGANLSSAGRGQEAPPEASPSRVSRVTPRSARDGADVKPDPTGARIGPPPSRTSAGASPRSRVNEPPVADGEGSRIIRSPIARTYSRGSVPRAESQVEPERPPRVLGTSTNLPAVRPEGAQAPRRERPGAPGTSGRGSRGGSR
ncbi:hypothetical protein [Vitiosangium sp. GDMCC 1.1324]|uniref:hypothetical protein n=1 Tax=Vitiosangium sp. (strain GDMCC 1.1324) TaxID=2138576 RepID=UPI000D3B988F|nr:hypothetical protein [Vitiosangium sp. GDMCC 1.1324]PTL80513.1 hypothetical protein DAT35_28165 [Vitiosangium sp. GDMCC 1.1324]